MIKTLIKDVVVDKYHNGYVIFPKGTEVKVLAVKEKDGYLNLLVTSLFNVHPEQPYSFIINADEFK